jgi:hypothetical protein
VLCTPLDIFEDVAEAVVTLPGTSVSAIAAGLDDWLGRSRRQRREQAERQARWLEQHDWARLSHRLVRLCTALRLNAPASTVTDPVG